MNPKVQLKVKTKNKLDSYEHSRHNMPMGKYDKKRIQSIRYYTHITNGDGA